MLKKNGVIVVLIAIFVLLPFLSSLLNFYTDWLFFVETGFTSVWKTTLAARIGSGFCFGFVFLLFVLTNLHFAYHSALPSARIYPEGGNVYRMRPDQTAHLLKPMSLLASLVLALLTANWGAMQWQNVLLFANRISVGTNDPVLGKDVGFYLFSLPLLEQLNAFAGFLLPATALMVAVLYYLRGGISLSERGAVIDPTLRRHLAILAGLYSLCIASGFYLSSFDLLLSGTSSFHGAGYADVHARLFTLQLLVFLTPIAGVVFAFGLWKSAWRCCRRCCSLPCTPLGWSPIRQCCKSSRWLRMNSTWRRLTLRTASSSPGWDTTWRKSRPFPSKLT
jgi:uncharacterized protein